MFSEEKMKTLFHLCFKCGLGLKFNSSSQYLKACSSYKKLIAFVVLLLLFLVVMIYFKMSTLFECQAINQVNLMGFLLCVSLNSKIASNDSLI